MKNKQKYDSRETSINKTKPAIYNKVATKISETDQVIDYGCGKYFDEYNLPENFSGYDPYNRPNEKVLEREYDIALCSNVLNVIMEKEVRKELLEILKSLANKTFITVYEGNKSGIGGPTKRNCYQLNRKKREYLPELKEVFENVVYKNGMFECWS